MTSDNKAKPKKSKKTANPVEIALRDKLAKCQAEGERWYRRLKRALTGLDKAKRRAARLLKQLEKLLAAP